MGYGLDLPRFHLPVSLHRKGGELNIVGCSGGLERIHETFPKRFSQDGPLPRWQAERLSRNLVNAHDPNILAERPNGKRGLLAQRRASHEWTGGVGGMEGPDHLDGRKMLRSRIALMQRAYGTCGRWPSIVPFSPWTWSWPFW